MKLLRSPLALLLVVAVACGGGLLWYVVSNLDRVERRGLLNDYARAAGDRVQLAKFVDALASPEQLHGSNRDLAAYLRARARLEVAHGVVASELEAHPARPEALVAAVTALEAAAADPALYRDFARAPAPERAAFEAELAAGHPDRDVLVPLLRDTRLAAGRRLAAADKPLAAWSYFAQVFRPHAIRAGHEVLLWVPALTDAERAAREAFESAGPEHTDAAFARWKDAAEALLEHTAMAARAAAPAMQGFDSGAEARRTRENDLREDLRALSDSALDEAQVRRRMSRWLDDPAKVEIAVRSAASARTAMIEGRLEALQAEVRRESEAAAAATGFAPELRRLAELADTPGPLPQFWSAALWLAAADAGDSTALQHVATPGELRAAPSTMVHAGAARWRHELAGRAALARARQLEAAALAQLRGLIMEGRGLNPEYQRELDGALAALEPFATDADPILRRKAAAALLNLRVEDLLLRWTRLVELEPVTLSFARKEDESLAAARRRLADGPQEADLHRINLLIDELERRTRFDEDPEVWVQVRLRKGQLVEFRGFLHATREAWLPLLEGREFAAAVAAGHVPQLAQFAAHWRGRLDELLREPLPGDDPLEQLSQLADGAAHARMETVLARLLSAPEPHARHAALHEQIARLHALAGHDAAPARTAAADAWLSAARADDRPDHWLRAGIAARAAGMLPRAIAALQHYFQRRAVGDVSQGRIGVMDCVAELALAFEAANILEGPETSPPRNAVAAWRWLEREAGSIQGNLPRQALDAWLGVARCRLTLGVARADAALLQQAIEGLHARLVNSATAPADFQATPAWREAQWLRGRAALELARLARTAPEPQPAVLAAHLALATQSFDDLVQRFHDDPHPHVNDARFRHAQAEWLSAVHARIPEGALGTLPLRRAEVRLGALLARTDMDVHLRREAVALRADALELLGRRLPDAVEARDATLAALPLYAGLENDYPGTLSALHAFRMRLECLKRLGRNQESFRLEAAELASRAPAALEAVTAQEWATAPRNQHKQWWTEQIAWTASQP